MPTSSTSVATATAATKSNGERGTCRCAEIFSRARSSPSAATTNRQARTATPSSNASETSPREACSKPS